MCYQAEPGNKKTAVIIALLSNLPKPLIFERPKLQYQEKPAD